MTPGMYRVTLTHNGETREVSYFTTDRSRAKQKAAMEYPNCDILAVTFDKEADDENTQTTHA